MNNNTLLTKDTILLDLDATSKTDAIHKICAHLFLMKKTLNPSLLYQDIIARENVVSTYAGCLTAIPHTISSHVDEPVLCFARTKDEDFSWNGSDEEVRFILLLSAPARDDLRKLRQSQSYVFSAVAQLISRHEVLERWLATDDQQEVLDSLYQAFQANLNTTIM